MCQGDQSDGRKKLTEPGKWYFVVDYLDSEKPIPLSDAPSPAEKPDPLRYRLISEVKCPHCNSVDTYTLLQIFSRMTGSDRQFSTPSRESPD